MVELTRLYNIDKAYDTALGMFTRWTATAWWEACYCLHQFNSNQYTITTIVYPSDGKPVGMGEVAKSLRELARMLPKCKQREDFRVLAKRYKDAVKEHRNKIAHAALATVDRQQVLHNNGKTYFGTDLEEAASEFFEISLQLNHFRFHPPKAWPCRK